MSLSKRERGLLIIVALLALLGLYYLLYLKPCLDDISDTNAKIESLEEENFNLTLSNAQAASLKTKIEEMDEQLSLYSDGIMHTFDQPPVIVYLSDTIELYIAEDYPAFYLGFECIPQIGSIELYTISTTFVTTYDDLQQLLTTLDNSPYLLRVSWMEAAIGMPEETTDTEEAGEEETGEEGTGEEGTTEEGTEETPPQSDIERMMDAKLIVVQMTLDFYCVSNPLPVDEEYPFDSPRQYGGDLFYP